MAHALTSGGHDASEDGTGRGTPLIVAASLTSGGHPNSNAPGRRKEDDENLVAIPLDLRNSLRADGKTGVGTPSSGVGEAGDPAYGVGGVVQAVAIHTTQDPIHHHHHHALGHEGAGVMTGASVRRLTPVECERLQGLPDGWTDLGGTPDSKRYAALGDAVTATVGYWLGSRIAVASGCA